jgi:hypothetical protein
MVKSTKEHLKMIKEMVMESAIMRIKKNIRESGKTINRTG